MRPDLSVRGVKVYRSMLEPVAQQHLLADLCAVVKAAPLFSPVTRWGKPMAVRMTSAGRYGWYSDRRGYRYERRHPSGVRWPPIPDRVLDIWSKAAGVARAPDCCLVNFYQAQAKMGMHQDKDEADFSWPIVSISLGDDGLFRIGNREHGGRTESLWLHSGDVVVMAGEARLLHHGLDRIRAGSSTLLKEGGRINLTLRVVD